MREIRVFDNVVPHPEKYRAFALAQSFRTFSFPRPETSECINFHGIALAEAPDSLREIIEPRGRVNLSFFRKSPLGQEEPHLIHTDVDMGDWSAILYLNPDPPASDGTSFWTHRASGEIENPRPHMRSAEGRTAQGWDLRQQVEAKFNRMVLFPSSFFHSRSIPENWGEGDEARLTHVTFGTGDLFS